MKVKDLIKELETFDGMLDVKCISRNDEDGFGVVELDFDVIGLDVGRCIHDIPVIPFCKIGIR